MSAARSGGGRYASHGRSRSSRSWWSSHPGPSPREGTRRSGSPSKRRPPIDGVPVSSPAVLSDNRGGGPFFVHDTGCPALCTLLTQVDTIAQPRSSSETAVGTQAVEVDELVWGKGTRRFHDLVEAALGGVRELPTSGLHLALRDQAPNHQVPGAAGRRSRSGSSVPRSPRSHLRLVIGSRPRWRSISVDHHRPEWTSEGSLATLVTNGPGRGRPPRRRKV